VLDRSPFYAEGGGQLADQGRLVLADGTVLEISDVQKALPDLQVHRARVVSGEATVGAQALAEVDVERRRAVSRAHTATHLVHQAIRAALGEQASQAGSLNAPGRFRFDFSSPGAVPESVLHDVEQEINEIALADLEVRAFVTSQEEARRSVRMALFGEKYGDRGARRRGRRLRRASCAAARTPPAPGQLGLVKLLSRLDRLRRAPRRGLGRAWTPTATSPASTSCSRSSRRRSRCPPRRCPTVARHRRAPARGREELATAAAAGGAASGPASTRPAARRLRFGWRRAGPPGHPATCCARWRSTPRPHPDERPAAVIVAAGGDRASLVAAVNDAGRARGLSASALLREAAVAVEGKGGGKDDVAQGGGAKVEGIADALVRAEHMVGRVATGGA
jgi:alanyl-tRNA synthetase